MAKLTVTRKAGAASKYRITLRDKDTKEIVKQTPWNKNKITDLGLSALYSDYGFFFGGEDSEVYLAVGTGSSAPEYTDTDLGSPLGPRNNELTFSYSTVTESPYAYSAKIAATWEAGDIVGDVSEIGMFADETGNTCRSRALLLDEEDELDPLEVTANHILTVEYELTVTFNEVDFTSPVNFGSYSGTLTLRPAVLGATPNAYNIRGITHGATETGGIRIRVSDGPIQDVTREPANPAGGAFNLNSISLIRVPVPEANVISSNLSGVMPPDVELGGGADMQSLQFYFAPLGGPSSQMGFNPPVPLDDVRGSTFSCQMSITRE